MTEEGQDLNCKKEEKQIELRSLKGLQINHPQKSKTVFIGWILDGYDGFNMILLLSWVTFAMFELQRGDLLLTSSTVSAAGGSLLSFKDEKADKVDEPLRWSCCLFITSFRRVCNQKRLQALFPFFQSDEKAELGNFEETGSL